MNASNKTDLTQVLSMLKRAIDGESIDIADVQKMEWSVDEKLDPLVQRIYRQLQMFASDADIRKKDEQYAKSWRDALAQHAEELRSNSEAPQGTGT
jgi:hypothetical protein